MYYLIKFHNNPAFGDPYDFYKVVSSEENLIPCINNTFDNTEVDVYEVYTTQEVKCDDGAKCFIPKKKIISGVRQ